MILLLQFRMEVCFLKKCISALLAVWMIASLTLAAFAQTDRNSASEYEGRVLAAINTNPEGDGGYFSATGNSESSQPVQAKSNDAQALKDVVLNNVEPLSPAEAMLQKARIGKNEENCVPESYRVGDKKTVFSAYSSDDSYFVKLICLYVGEYCTVWGTEQSQEQIEESAGLGQFFDSKRDEALELFGDKRVDTDKDGKIAIFYYPMVDVGGYFSHSDLADRFGRIDKVFVTTLLSSNACDCIHVSSEGSLAFACSTALHEYEHYINASYCYLGKNNFNALLPSESYINEAFSTASQYVLNQDSSHAIGFKWATMEPQNYSLLGWTGSFEDYSLSFVFGQYIRTRYAQLTGDTQGDTPGKGVYKRILELRTPENDDNTLGIIADLLYPQNDYPELKNTMERSRQLIADFWLATALREQTGVHGFNGDRIEKEIPSPYIFDALPEEQTHILNSAAAFYKINGGEPGTAVISENESDLTFVGLDRVGYTLRLCPNYGTAEPLVISMIDQYELYSHILDEYMLRAGYDLSGFSEQPNAATAQYNVGDTIVLTRDMELYAVWEPRDSMELNTLYTLNLNDGDGYLAFTCPESGYYTFDTVGLDSDCYPYSYIESLGESDYSSSNDVRIEEEMRRLITYYIEAGTVCNICVSSWDGGTVTVRVYREAQSFTLRYDLNGLPVDLWLVDSENSRESFGSMIHEVSYDAPNTREIYNILGWSTDKTATQPEYFGDEILTLTQDTTLYLVWAMPAAMEEDIAVDVPLDVERVFSFTPKKDGTYTFGFADAAPASENLSLSISAGKTLGDTVGIDADAGCSLSGGTTYYIWLYVYNSDDSEEWLGDDTVGLQVTRTLPFKRPCNLTFAEDPYDGATEYFTLSGGTRYIIPDLIPASEYGRTFAGWLFDNGDFYSDGTIYKVGDTVEIISDATLFPVWEGPSRELSPYEYLSEYASYNLLFVCRAAMLSIVYEALYPFLMLFGIL